MGLFDHVPIDLNDLLPPVAWAHLPTGQGGAGGGLEFVPQHGQAASYASPAPNAHAAVAPVFDVLGT